MNRPPATTPRGRGTGLNPKQVARAVQLSAEKYCSASLMLERGGVEITHDFEIIDADAISASGGDAGAQLDIDLRWIEGEPINFGAIRARWRGFGQRSSGSGPSPWRSRMARD